MDDFKIGWEKQNICPTWKIPMKDVDLWEPTSFLDHARLGCTLRECQTVRTKDFCRCYRKINRNKSDGETRCGKDIFMVQWHGRSRKDVCGKILRISIKVLDNSAKSQRHAWKTSQFEEEEFGLVEDTMSIFRSYRWTRYFVVCEQTCSCGHDMDKSLCQTLGAFDLEHHTSEYRQFCEETQRINADLDCFKDSDFAGDLEDSKSTSGGVLWKSHVCANKLDVQETDFSFTQFYRSWNHLFGCRCTHGRYSRSPSLGFVRVSYGENRRQLSSQTCITYSHRCFQSHSPDQSVFQSFTDIDARSAVAQEKIHGTLWHTVVTYHHQTKPNKAKDVTEPRGNLSANTQRNMRKQIPTTNTKLDLTNIDHVSIKRDTFWFQCSVVCLGR